MEIYNIENLSFAYPNSQRCAIKNINLSINRGEFVTLCGKSGCGKTTLLRMMKPTVSPCGTVNGTVLYNGRPTDKIDARTLAADIGFVMQSPDNQIITDKVWHELAFGLESLGLSNDRIRTRVSEMASFFGIQNWFYKKTSELSGGQKQLLNLASVMVMQPSVLILDEPTCQLDPIAAQDFLQTLHRINEELGTTVILSEHRLEDAFSISDRVIVMDCGEIIADEAPRIIGKALMNNGDDMFESLPAPMRVFGALGGEGEYPLTVREGKDFLNEYIRVKKLDPDLVPEDGTPPQPEKSAIEIKDAYFRYEKSADYVIKGLTLTVNRGEIFSVVGGNGTGKSTAVSLAAGINRPQRGKVLINGKKIDEQTNLYDGLLGVMPQNPQTLFAKKTVRLDMMSLTDKKMNDAERSELVSRTAAICRIENLLGSHPYDLSGGEQQRAALAMILLKNPQILILDEPTKGMDAHFKRCFADILKELKSRGAAILMVSHDIEFCALVSDRCAMFFDGAVTSVGTPRKFFGGNSFYTTSANRMAREILPNAISADDIIAAASVKYGAQPPSTDSGNNHGETAVSVENPQTVNTNRQTALSDGTDRESNCASGVISTVAALIAVPLTILFGIYRLGDRRYYFISMLIILEILVPLCIRFENRARGESRAREIVIISVLCALGVAGRAAFYMLPEFKPVIAIVVVSAICFGGEVGFLVGAVTAFVSNFFFGQGPWTPWQMFAFGTVGFLGGFVFRHGMPAQRKAIVAIFGFAATLVIYGGIMNIASVLMMTAEPTWGAVASAIAMGLPFDLIHAAASAFFLWFITEPMIEKLERVKLKYGILPCD